MRGSIQHSTIRSTAVTADRAHETIDFSKARAPDFRRKIIVPEKTGSYSAPETQFIPRENRNSPLRYVIEKPGMGYVHAVTISEIKDFLSTLPPELSKKITESVDVIKLSGRTRKNATENLYGLQWGCAVYLYPFNESMSELYPCGPAIADRIQTERYGGKWIPLGGSSYQLSWRKESLKDFYLCEVLMHEIGHVLDKKNTVSHAREQFADWFATTYGYLPWREKQAVRKIYRHHHST